VRAAEPWSAAEARAVLDGIDDPAPVLVALQALQERFGYVHADAIPMVAAAFAVTRADVYGVLTFYRDLRTTPPAGVQVRVCMGEACQSVGARRLRADVDTLVDPDVEVGVVYCLGNCALGPAAVVDGRLVGRATAAGVRASIEAARTGS
jgi:NADH:ubiquinone oxidoreductase subunit E